MYIINVRIWLELKKKIRKRQQRDEGFLANGNLLIPLLALIKGGGIHSSIQLI